MTLEARRIAEEAFYEGVRQLQGGDAARAIDCFRSALAGQPDFAEANANLGLLLEGNGDLPGAEECYRRAIRTDPESFEVRLNLGALLAERKEFAAAERLYREAVLLRPASASPWSNLGVLYACQHREIEAEQCFRTAIDLDESYGRARFNLAYVLLRQGRFAEGWRCLEYREWRSPRVAELSCPRWQGESLQGKDILVGCEAGIGDMIQFSRYADSLKELGARRVSMLCHPQLLRLLRGLAAIDELIALDQPLPEQPWDYWTPLLSIPRLCGTTLDSIPAPIPYLRASGERTAEWRQILARRGFRVGLVWKGNPRFENDADRSLPSLAVLAPLATVAGVQFVGLQKGAGEGDTCLAAALPPIANLGPDLRDFADTADLLAELDLLISVDTAVVHLAGAMGKPCWLLLPAYKADWRWLKERADSPWYPKGMRLFRQEAGADWNPLVANVAAALQSLVDQSPSD